ncbi:MAG: hypothetical protein DWQ04_02585 [Chloroflexi bacterium]|nr:MAG: hypothetical protein DWQ04_02585 [Chloroflexota bacterium]
MGLGIGGGQFSIVTMALIGAMIILWVFPKFEEWIYNVRERRTYEMVCDVSRNQTNELERLFQRCGFNVKGHKLIKHGDEMVCIIDAYGTLDDHEQVMEKLLAEKDVKEFHY